MTFAFARFHTNAVRIYYCPMQFALVRRCFPAHRPTSLYFAFHGQQREKLLQRAFFSGCGWMLGFAALDSVQAQVRAQTQFLLLTACQTC